MSLSVGMNTMAKKTSKKPAKAAKPRKAVAKSSARKSSARKSSARKPAKASTPVLLSGGNPQIAKGYGDSPVQA